MYESFGDFRPDYFPQSIIHGDLDASNCLFNGDRLSAFLDWQEVGIGACVVDFGLTVLGFCFVDDPSGELWAKFDFNLYKSLLDGYSQVRPFTRDEIDEIETAVKYVGLTQPVWSMLHWGQFHPSEEMVETNTLFWRYGLDRLTL